jgi:hypothetical protein
MAGVSSNGQNTLNSEFRKIYSFALQEDIHKVMNHLDTLPIASFTTEQLAIKQKYHKRFRTGDEVIDYNTPDPTVQKILAIYQRYWKTALLTKTRNDLDSVLKENVTAFLIKQGYKKDSAATATLSDNFALNLKDYLRQHGYYSATGKTGGLFDLFIWKRELPVIDTETLLASATESKVVFLEDVITMGWEEYATFGKYYPGGWATKEMLYCVRKAYDTTSENFKVSYLKHEAQHFADYKQFPALTGADLEYRAKLTELVFAETTRYELLRTFCRNASAEGRNSHAFANYCTIRDLSRGIFHQEFVDDIEKWKTVPAILIVKWSQQLFQEHSEMLKKAGAATVKELIH